MNPLRPLVVVFVVLFVALCGCPYNRMTLADPEHPNRPECATGFVSTPWSFDATPGCLSDGDYPRSLRETGLPNDPEARALVRERALNRVKREDRREEAATRWYEGTQSYGDGWCSNYIPDRFTRNRRGRIVYIPGHCAD